MDREGRYLINGLAEAGWYIFNGCGKGDEGENGRMQGEGGIGAGLRNRE